MQGLVPDLRERGGSSARGLIHGAVRRWVLVRGRV